MIIKERGLWMLAGAAGLAVLITVILIMPYFPAQAAQDISGYGSPVIAFEFARTLADLIAVFGAEMDGERAERIAMMDQGNRLDFIFMMLYTLFGVLFGMAVRQTHRALGAVIIVAALIAGVADAVETRTLLLITAQMMDGMASQAGTPKGLSMLWVPVTIKFIGIALSILCAGLFLGAHVNVTWKALGALTVLAALLSLPALLAPASLGHLLTPSVGVGWIVMLAFAATRTVPRITPQD